jgi:hypothetical protein
MDFKNDTDRYIALTVAEEGAPPIDSDGMRTAALANVHLGDDARTGRREGVGDAASFGGQGKHRFFNRRRRNGDV